LFLYVVQNVRNQPGAKFEKILASDGPCCLRRREAKGFGNLGGQLNTESPATSKTWIHGTGRRKESVARVFLRAGSGKFTINKRTVDVYFPNHAWKHDAIEPLKFTNLSDQVDVVITAHGGGVGGQAGAVRMGLARAISRFNPELRPALRTNGFLTRDSRMKERKKYGQKGARKRFQFTKR
jgi:small subunit ribosomal protein S9